MVEVIFVDTSAWFALLDRNCLEHERAKRFAATCDQRLITTDYVLAESLTLLRARRLNLEASELGAKLLSERPARLAWVTPQDVHQAWMYFQYRDKAWSFVDGVSFAVIQRLSIDEAFAFDEHFQQFGSFRFSPGRD